MGGHTYPSLGACLALRTLEKKKKNRIAAGGDCNLYGRCTWTFYARKYDRLNRRADGLVSHVGHVDHVCHVCHVCHVFQVQWSVVGSSEVSWVSGGLRMYLYTSKKRVKKIS